MNLYLIFSHLIVAILSFMICCFWQKRKLKLDMETGGYNSSSLISDEATRKLIEHYRDTLPPDFNPIKDKKYTDPFIEARVAWVSFSDLRKYMRYLELLSLKNGLVNVTNLGIRMYYGRYPDDASEMLRDYNKNNTITDKFKGRHTLAMVPTFNNGKTNMDFNPHYIEKGRPIEIHTIRKRKMDMHQERPQSSVISKTPVTPEANNAHIGSESIVDTDVNLNSFGLTPPTSNIDDGAAYLKP